MATISRLFPLLSDIQSLSPLRVWDAMLESTKQRKPPKERENSTGSGEVKMDNSSEGTVAPVNQKRSYCDADLPSDVPAVTYVTATEALWVGRMDPGNFATVLWQQTALEPDSVTDPVLPSLPSSVHCLQTAAKPDAKILFQGRVGIELRSPPQKAQAGEKGNDAKKVKRELPHAESGKNVKSLFLPSSL
uniref:Uncharacterized protein n=1 Tax=Chromera velia CCMP2878 TaxID=1169474 RepID=A0A0G4GVI9_9ALVE|eukprot:Cvel_23566.t1-p1 / transcript=Cvel_23566.t1 / gene=Cvel_23566 / organism=Chromera_velia_CCMP2878 / gene_product=hypothetical protein / transcript_product=hypothetical protein / location=Cvel_scaffold2443:12930-13496(-) / protein_length=189 / sequence_SO=supercontig / SO=protein_coding / is_pseudo=false